MHILDLTMFWAPASGGVRTYLEAKHQWLRGQPDIVHSLLVPGGSETCSDGLCTLPAPRIPLGNGYRFPLRKTPWIEKITTLQPDLIEVGDPYVLPWAALQAGEVLDIPVVGFYHSDLPRLIGSRAGHWTNRWLDRYVSRLYRRFDQVLAPSRVMADKLRHLGVERVATQPLGVDTHRFDPDKRDPDVRRELGITADTRLLIFAGRGSREKNIPLLLQTMRRLGPRYHLHLAGSHMPERLPDNVSRSTGFIDQGRLSRLLSSSDALIHAGDHETFGLIVLEAMASGLPVIGVDAGAVAELIVPGTGLLARAGSVESLAGQVETLFTMNPHQMGLRARQYVVSTFDWQVVLPQLLTHYRGLLAQEAGLPRLASGGVING